MGKAQAPRVTGRYKWPTFPPPEPPPAQPYGQSDLEAGMNRAAGQGGGVVAGSHPEFDNPTPLDKAIAAVKGLTRKKRKP